VWWAWWAHRRGPVGHLFAALIGVIGLCAVSPGCTWHGGPG
jgi:hypothetical protein